MIVIINFNPLIIHHHHHHQWWGRCVAQTAWPQRIARLQSFTGELLESRRIRLLRHTIFNKFNVAKIIEMLIFGSGPEPDL